MIKLQERIDSANCLDVSHDESWLWADVKKVSELKAEAPASITAARDRNAWANDERQRRVDMQLEKLSAHLRPGTCLHATSDGTRRWTVKRLRTSTAAAD